MKGNGFELEVVKALEAAGIPAKRVPLSGALKNSHPELTGDVQCTVLGRTVVLEAKRCMANFKTFYRWIAPVFGVVFRDDNEDALITIRLKDFIELTTAAAIGRWHQYPNVVRTAEVDAE